MSPLIEELRWGHMAISGLGNGKDFKLWPGGGRPWDWGETGTHHRPGIQVADVTDLIEQGAETVVLSRGLLMALHTTPEVLDHLNRQGIVTVIEETRRAAEDYNQRARRGEPVGGLFHSTC